MNSRWRARVQTLPIATHLKELASKVESHGITILESPPGTGKTTVLPLALLEEEWLKRGSILVLQPRRLAARSVATRMADLIGESVGETVGYSVRLESKRSRHTRVEVITEGLLTRRLISDPELSGVGVVIFDEFHERSIHADLSLALTLETQNVLRPDLRVVVMSATLGESLPADFFGGAHRYSISSKTFPVEVRYETGEARTPLWERMASLIRGCVSRYEGDILAFLPGVFEIQRTHEALDRHHTNGVVTPLYGDLPYPEQVRAINPDPEGRRKIVLATTIAETSLTIEGVRIVIDSGLHRVSRVDEHGVSCLSTEPISRDAADQRAGRAGRTAPGVCIRMWSEQDHRARRPFREPEVVRSDLTPAILDLAAWGVTSPETFNWVTVPPIHALTGATNALQSINAISEGGAITSHGKVLAGLGAHPLLGTIAVTARSLGLERFAAPLLALLEERDIFSGRPSTANIHDRLHALAHSKGSNQSTRRLADVAARWHDRIMKLPSHGNPSPLNFTDEDAVATLLGLAFPARIARRRADSTTRYLLASGRGATLVQGDPLGRAEFLATCSLQDASGDMTIRLAAPLNIELFESTLRHLVNKARSVEVNPESGALAYLTQLRIGSLVIRSRVDERPTPDEIAESFSSWLSGEGFSKIPFNEASEQLIARIAWATAQGTPSSLPNVSRETLRGSVTDWLIPHLAHPPTLRSLTDHVVRDALLALLSWNQRRELDEIAPSHFILPSGRARPITYTADKPPFFSARIQDLFGVRETPRIGRSHTPVAIHLLSPAHRPVQVTQDLASFWRHGYPEVRKELRGRYPKHRWPEDPLGT